jgi:hypothetical protein
MSREQDRPTWRIAVFRRFRPRLTYANVVSTACLFILLGGGA